MCSERRMMASSSTSGPSTIAHKSKRRAHAVRLKTKLSRLGSSSANAADGEIGSMRGGRSPVWNVRPLRE